MRKCKVNFPNFCESINFDDSSIVRCCLLDLNEDGIPYCNLWGKKLFKESTGNISNILPCASCIKSQIKETR